MNRYRRPATYSPHGADEYYAALDWQDGELATEDARLAVQELEAEKHSHDWLGDPYPADCPQVGTYEPPPPACWMCRGDPDASECNWICGLHANSKE